MDLVKAKRNYTTFPRSELIIEVAELAGITKAQANLVINTIARVMSEALNRGDEVIINRFGRFYTLPFNPLRSNIHQQWGAPLPKPKRIAKFKAHDTLMLSINPHWAQGHKDRFNPAVVGPINSTSPPLSKEPKDEP